MKTPIRLFHSRVARRSTGLINTPLQRGVCASNVEETVSTVSTAFEKPLKRFLLSIRPDTPLKRGANERRQPQRVFQIAESTPYIITVSVVRLEITPPRSRE